MNNKISTKKEKMRQALTSTLRVISEDFEVKNLDKKKPNNKENEVILNDNSTQNKSGTGGGDEEAILNIF